MGLTACLRWALDRAPAHAALLGASLMIRVDVLTGRKKAAPEAKTARQGRPGPRREAFHGAIHARTTCARRPREPPRPCNSLCNFCLEICASGGCGRGLCPFGRHVCLSRRSASHGRQVRVPNFSSQHESPPQRARLRREAPRGVVRRAGEQTNQRAVLRRLALHFLEELVWLTFRMHLLYTQPGVLRDDVADEYRRLDLTRFGGASEAISPVIKNSPDTGSRSAAESRWIDVKRCGA